MHYDLIALGVVCGGAFISREFFIHIKLTKLTNDVAWIKKLLDRYYNNNE